VRLKDGTVISVQDLKRGFLSQQSFTRGTQDNAKERETLSSQKAEVEQYARSLQEQRDFILQVAQQYIPQPPDRSLLDRNSTNFDPVTYAQWREKQLWQAGRWGVDSVDMRARNIDTLDDLEKTSLDFYASVRNLYRQTRNNEIQNGASDVQALPNF